MIKKFCYIGRIERKCHLTRKYEKSFLVGCKNIMFEIAARDIFVGSHMNKFNVFAGVSSNTGVVDFNHVSRPTSAGM